jgi:hypothetical protein
MGNKMGVIVTGICEHCKKYKSKLRMTLGKWMCPPCREVEGFDEEYLDDYMKALNDLDIRYKGLYAKAKHIKDVQGD